MSEPAIAAGAPISATDIEVDDKLRKEHESDFVSARKDELLGKKHLLLFFFAFFLLFFSFFFFFFFFSRSKRGISCLIFFNYFMSLIMVK
jgi:hypothetical protein